MFSFYNIRVIAKYELKILLRSWFFRIFAILTLVIIGFYSGAMILNKSSFTWMFRSLPTSLMYSAMFFLNILQSIIAVFLATDFLKRDKKLDTSEVLFIRPMSNSEYVWGKTLGLLLLFLILNLLVFLLTSIFIWISPEVSYNLIAFLSYFLLVSIPALLFITGLSFALMTFLKNQSITFILLLGYVALVLFYLGGKVNYLFDYMVFKMPLAYSDIIGFSHLGDKLLQRLSYAGFGVGLILFATWRLKRIPNTSGNNTAVAILSLLVILASGAGFYKIVTDQKILHSKRDSFKDICSLYFDKAVPLMKNDSIIIDCGDRISATSAMTLLNNTQETIDTLFFSINPGFKIDEVTFNGNKVPFTQTRLLVEVFMPKPLKPDDKCSVGMKYSGTPDFDISYLDNDFDDVYGYDSEMMLRIDKNYGFYDHNYILLTKENLWYPTPGIVYDPSRPAIFRQQFTRFDLLVKTRQGMIPVSQGDRTTSDSLAYHFKIRDPLPQVSLAVANFMEGEIDIDGIGVGIAYINGHDFFTNNVSELKDTLKSLITEFLDDYERPLNMYYPYSRFTLVESPVQFHSLPHSWTATLAQSQPQMVFYPEFGFNVETADFSSAYRRMKNMSDRNKEGLEKKEIQARIFTNFMKQVFAGSSAGSRFGPRTSSTSNPYSIFPNYYYYVDYITSASCPVLNYAFESYLMNGEDDPRQMFFSRMMGLGDNETANMLLEKKSLKQIIAEEDDQQAVNRVLKVKGSYLLSWMEKQMPGTDFNKFLLDYLYNNSFREIKYSELADVISQRFNVKLGDFISQWYNASKLPAFGLGSTTVREVIDQSQSKYVVNTKVTNYSDVAGLVKLTFELGDQRGFGPFGGGGSQSEPENRIFLIDANQTKEFQIVLSESPRSMIFNTLLSQNIPSSSMQFGLHTEKDENGKAVEFEKVLDEPVEISQPGELIVDNTSKGFSVNDPSLNNPIRKFFAQRNKKDDDEFVGEGFGQAPTTWSKTANSDYFGEIEHSAMVIRSGDGSKTAIWKVKMPAEGYYDVYVYLTSQRRFGRRGRGGGGGENQPKGKYVYTINHEDGAETIELETKDFENGWNLLGSYYLPVDTAKVTLSDKGGADRVVADAVKWVLQR